MASCEVKIVCNCTPEDYLKVYYNRFGASLHVCERSLDGNYESCCIDLSLGSIESLIEVLNNAKEELLSKDSL
jgi:hypothetical protein